MTESLAVLEQWKADSQLFISLAPPFTATLEVDRAVMRDTLARSTLSLDEFKAASDEIGLILLNVLNGTEDRYVLGPGGGDAEGPDPDAQEQRGAYVEEVKARLYDGYLQRRYDLKKSSKALSFNDDVSLVYPFLSISTMTVYYPCLLGRDLSSLPLTPISGTAKLQAGPIGSMQGFDRQLLLNPHQPVGWTLRAGISRTRC